MIEMLFYEISTGQSDRHNQISDCKNAKNGWSMTVTGHLATINLGNGATTE